MRSFCLRRAGCEARTEQVEQLTILSRLLLYPATFFLGAGIFLGAVWANVYGAAFHEQDLRFFRNPLYFHLYLILAFLTVLMTYFGVNYVLGGMHSYANG